MKMSLSKPAMEKIRTGLVIVGVCTLLSVGQRLWKDSFRFIPTCPTDLNKPEESNFLIYHLPDGGYMLKENVFSNKVVYHANHEGNIISKSYYSRGFIPSQTGKFNLDADVEDSLLVKRILREDGWLK